MIEQLKTIRYLMDTYCPECHDGYAALTQLEAMVGKQEPVAWMLPSDGGECAVFREPSDFLPPYSTAGWTPLYAAPPAQQYEAGDMASAAAQGFRDGVASVAQQPQGAPQFPTMLRKMWSGGEVQQWINENWPAAPQQPQARPDFTDEWTGYLKNGETPFERFLRERKDVQSALKLYQRALEENERLKAQQPQAEAVPTIYVSRGQLENLKPDPEDEAGTYLPVRKTPKGKFTHPLFAAPQQAEAVPSDAADKGSCIHGVLMSNYCDQCAAIAQQKGASHE